ncbi:hypothetical protein [Flavobacterium sp.]|jgi:hypothetical protein|uniref:hypothetical protein n=1 Tax=Flavobacterium sp. TaxID=239 RepID=UPI0037C0DD60
MKKIFLIIASIFVALLSCPIFAQEDPGADPEAPAAPIDDYVVFLAAISLIYVFLKLRTFAQQRNTSRE